MPHLSIADYINGALAFATFFLAIYSVKQAHAAKANAEAALLNAEAVIRTERPWLVVTLLPDTKSPGLFRCVCRNQGNTPATILSISADVSFVELPDKLPIPPLYNAPSVMPDSNLVAKDDTFWIGVGGIRPESVLVGKPERALVNQRRLFFVYYGNVIYRDMLYGDTASEGLHETRWCFVYKPSDEGLFDQAPVQSRVGTFVRSGPTEYNRYS